MPRRASFIAQRRYPLGADGVVGFLRIVIGILCGDGTWISGHRSASVDGKIACVVGGYGIGVRRKTVKRSGTAGKRIHDPVIDCVWRRRVTEVVVSSGGRIICRVRRESDLLLVEEQSKAATHHHLVLQGSRAPIET